jgi:hypothetical protein
MDQSEIQNMFSEKSKCFKIIKSFKFSFKNKLAFNKEQWNCVTNYVKFFLTIDEYDKLILNETKLNQNNWIYNNHLD